MRLTDDAMLVFARMMNEECQERSCLDCTFFIEQERKCLFDSRPVVWDDLPDTVDAAVREAEDEMMARNELKPAIVEVEKNDKETVDCSMRFLRKNRKCKNGV